MSDKSRRWYFYKGWLAAQKAELVRLDESCILKETPRCLFAKFLKEEKANRATKKKVWRFKRGVNDE